MATYLFEAYPAIDPQTGQPAPLPGGVITQFVLCLPGGPGSLNGTQVGGYARQYGLGTQGVNYKIKEIGPQHSPLYFPVMPQGAPNLSGAHVQGGQPSGAPRGQPRAGRPQGPRDPRSKFQTLGDADLDGAGDSLYGGPSPDEATWSDIYVGGGFGGQEVPRQ
jgi:hypothetical protein